MGIINNTLTEREKAALYYHIFTGCKDWKTLYLIAIDAAQSDAQKDNKYLSAFASRWKNTQKVQNFITETRDRLAIEENKKRERWENERRESERKETERGTGHTSAVDYTNPENQRKKLNELVNNASDPGEALDALKVIISGQRDDKQAAREQKQVRAYLPLSCQDCPLYKKSKRPR